LHFNNVSAGKKEQQQRRRQRHEKIVREKRNV